MKPKPLPEEGSELGLASPIFEASIPLSLDLLKRTNPARALWKFSLALECSEIFRVEPGVLVKATRYCKR